MTLRLVAATSLAGLLLLAGCGTPQAVDPGGSGPGVPDGTYLSTSVTVGGAPRPLVPGTRVQLTLAGDQVSLSAGCNRFLGTARWDGDRLTLTNLGGTEMGCRPALDAQDSWLNGLFQVPVTVEPDGRGLVVTSGDTVLTFGAEDEPSVALQGTRWLLDSLGDPGGGDAAASSVPAGVRAWLEIADGTLQLDTGCNTGSGSVRVDDATLVIGDVAMTQIGCPGARAQVEARMLAVLHGSVGYGLAAGRLTLTGADGSTLSFRPDDDAATADTPDLQGPLWQLTSVVQHDGDVTSTGVLPDQLVATLQIKGGRLLVNTGCNVGNATVTVSGDTLEVGPLMLTKRACRADDGAVEGAFVGVLDGGTVRWTVADGALTLSDPDGATELVYTAG